MRKNKTMMIITSKQSIKKDLRLVVIPEEDKKNLLLNNLQRKNSIQLNQILERKHRKTPKQLKNKMKNKIMKRSFFMKKEKN